MFCDFHDLVISFLVADVHIWSYSFLLCLPTMWQEMCNNTVSVHRSHPATAAGLLLWAQQPGDIDWLMAAGQLKQPHTAANAGSATLSADVGSWTHLFVDRRAAGRADSWGDVRRDTQHSDCEWGWWAGQLLLDRHRRTKEIRPSRRVHEVIIL